MKKTLLIHCKNIGKYINVPIGSTLLDVYNSLDFKLPYLVTSAKVNNVVRELTYSLYKNKTIEFIDVSSDSGKRTYARTLIAVVYMAIKRLYPEMNLNLEYGIRNGFYGKLIDKYGHSFIPKSFKSLTDEIHKIIEEDIPIYQEEIETDKVIDSLEAEGLNDKAELLRSRGSIYTESYRIGTHLDYSTGSLFPSTGWIYKVNIEPFFEGFILTVPSKVNPNDVDPILEIPKMFELLKDTEEFNRVIGLPNVGALNNAIKNDKTADLSRIAEALQEKQIANIADQICNKTPKIKVVLISGPSSSGKTTFSKRLGIQLLTNSISPQAISLDDYFVERVNTPLDENGDYDYESIEALDLPLFHHDLELLLAGEEVEIPTYNFETGKREYRGNKIKLNDNTILIMEGIHALNPRLTENIANERKFKIYVSVLTTIPIDCHNWIPTSDNRLIRRIIRDYNTRGYSAQDTISRWTSVRRGEEKWILPFQIYADAMFNSSLIFELSVLRHHAEYILSEVPQNCDEYSEAHRLLQFIRDFKPFPEKEIPRNSLIREFVGGSSFYKY